MLPFMLAIKSLDISTQLILTGRMFIIVVKETQLLKRVRSFGLARRRISWKSETNLMPPLEVHRRR